MLVIDGLIWFLVFTAAFFIILFYVIKGAVREGILEADRRRFGNNLHETRPSPKTFACPSCKHEYHKDNGRCPICLFEKPEHNNENLTEGGK